jgi:hypothetical protein
LLLGEVRELSTAFRQGGDIPAFRHLTALLLSRTILAKGHPGPGLITRKDQSQVAQLGGMGAFLRPLPLLNKRYLAFQISLAKMPHKDGGEVWKVLQARYQYQADDEEGMNDTWLFRYDNLREPGADIHHPSAHLNLNANPAIDNLVPPHPQHLSDIHFPTRRVSFEAVIRLLIEEFDVPSLALREEWEPMLAESEKMFFQIAHDP